MNSPGGVEIIDVKTPPASARPAERRCTERITVALPARLTWKDRSGTTRFAAVTARDVSELGVFVECRTPLVLPLYRLVYLQLEAGQRSGDGLPACLGKGRALAAVYRVRPQDGRGQTQGFALRLMVEPRRLAERTHSARATA
jgi:hypothetical protein